MLRVCAWCRAVFRGGRWSERKATAEEWEEGSHGYCDECHKAAKMQAEHGMSLRERQALQDGQIVEVWLPRDEAWIEARVELHERGVRYWLDGEEFLSGPRIVARVKKEKAGETHDRNQALAFGESPLQVGSVRDR